MICFSGIFFLMYLSRIGRDNLFIEGIVLLILLLLFYKVYNGKRFTIYLFIFSFMIRLGVSLMNNVEPVSDFAVMYNAAQYIKDGGKNLQNFSGNYFRDWAYQTGFVLYEAIILKIWNSIWALKIMNCLFSAGINVLIYQIAKLMWGGEREAQLVSILYLIFPFSLLHTGILSNSHISAFFLFLGVYFLIQNKYEKSKINIVMSAFCVAIGNIMRPDAIIFLVSFIVLIVFQILSNVSWKNVKNSCIKLIIFLGVYGGIVSFASGIIQFSEINSEGLKNADPLYKFSVGFDYETKGGYSKKTLELIRERSEEFGDLKKAEISIIKERINFSLEFFDLLVQKIGNFWWGSGWIVWNNLDWQNIFLIKASININYSIFWFITILIVLALKRLYLLSKEDKRVFFMPFVIFSSFCVYLLIEIQERYTYLPQIAFFITAAGGIGVIEEKWKNIGRYRDNVINIKNED